VCPVYNRLMSRLLSLAFGVAIIAHVTGTAAQKLPYEAMAKRAVAAISPASGERVLLRVDPGTMPGFEPVLRSAFEGAGARVQTVRGRDVADFEKRLADTDVYVWMPGGSAITSPEQSAALRRWVDQGGPRRELHFHWAEGTLTLEQMPAPQTPEMDRVYAEALEIDYAALDRAQDAAIALLQSGAIRVTTPAGTRVSFRTGPRPFNKQNGDGSRRRVARARMRIDRHIELPAGIIRVAPLETSVTGVVVLPSMRVGAGAPASNVRLQFAAGKVVKVDAGDRTGEVERALQSQPALAHFRELGIGMNPKLALAPGATVVPYYAYGAGMVRLSLGDNEELGGAVRGQGVMWNFFKDATVTIGPRVLVKNGTLMIDDPAPR
jgi:hypothetical protein